MTVFSPRFSPRTTNPDGRNGRSPVIVRMTRSADTRTRASRASGAIPAGTPLTEPRLAAQPASNALVPPRKLRLETRIRLMISRPVARRLDRHNLHR